MRNLTPFLLFDGDCAQAMTSYRSCLGGELELSATDRLHPVRKPRQGNTVAIYLTGSTYTELKEIFDRLSAGAPKDLLDELRDMPFGTYGHLADKYGVHSFFRGERRNAMSSWLTTRRCGGG